MQHPRAQASRHAKPRLLAVAFALFFVGTMPRMSVAQTPQAPSTTYPQRWEYKVVPLGAIAGTNQMYGSGQNGSDFTKPFEDGLAKYGTDGWELVSIDTLQSNKVAIFKRPITTPTR